MSFRFRKFKVYNDAQLWIKDIFSLAVKIRKRSCFELANQIERAGLSVIMNIAEGSNRGSDKDFNRFLDISLGSLSEVIAGLDTAQRLGFINTKEFDHVIISSEILAKQLGGFKKYLKNV